MSVFANSPAAYLDEAGDEPLAACETLLKLGLTQIALRYVWSSNICEASDLVCDKLRQVLAQHGIKTVLLASELGKTETAQLATITPATINRACLLANYFGVNLLRVYIGTGKPDAARISAWMTRISEATAKHGVTPLLEVTDDCAYFEPAELATLLREQPRWRLLYDPAQLVLKRNHDPFVKYWSLLRNSVLAVDVHDYKAGIGHRPAGYGDCRLNQTLADYSGLRILEHGLGRRYGGALTRSDTFSLAYSAYDALLNGPQTEAPTQSPAIRYSPRR